MDTNLDFGFRISNFKIVPVLLLLSLGISGTAMAHPKTTPSVREILRLQGHKMSEGGSCEEKALRLAVFGAESILCLGDFRRLALATDQPPELAAEPKKLDLRGERSLLARYVNATSDHQITILGEWRPGRSDVFVITVDLCPGAE
jgi:hypothetical protein